MADKFKIAPGYFVLSELTVDEINIPSPNEDVQKMFIGARALRVRGYYILASHGVKTPFGYYTNEKGKARIKVLMQELHNMSLELNRSGDGDFVVNFNTMFVQVPQEDEVLRVRLAQFVIERLEHLRAKVARGDRRALTYTQDGIKRLDLFCSEGIYAQSIRKSLVEAATVLKQVKDGASDPQFPIIDGTIALFERDLKGEGNQS